MNLSKQRIWLAAMILYSSCGQLVSAEDDLIKDFKAKIPDDWSVEMSSDRGKCRITVSTQPMNTVFSPHANERPERSARAAMIQIPLTVLPRYSQEMLNAIRKHNEVVHKETETLRFGTAAWNDANEKLIDVPDFYDDKYGYKVDHVRRVPADKKDVVPILDGLVKVTSSWKSYDVKQPNVIAHFRRHVTPFGR